MTTRKGHAKVSLVWDLTWTWFHFTLFCLFNISGAFVTTMCRFRIVALSSTVVWSCSTSHWTFSVSWPVWKSSIHWKDNILQ